MSALIETLRTLHRPRILMSAARHGVSDYDRTRSLARILRQDVTPSPEQALSELMRQEAELERDRMNGDAAYSVTRHIDLLIAMLGEARLALRPVSVG